MNALIDRLLQHEAINFTLTNRLPRKWLTRVIGRISKSEHPLLARPAIALWRLFADIDFSDSQQQTFRSMHECFTRQLRPGARPVDTTSDVITSPCDGIVGACGSIEDLMLLQAKRHRYTLPALIGDVALAEKFRDGCYVTLRLTSGMYHRFHAPHDARIEQVRYFSGDVWNVNPAALNRVPRLFCENERAVLRLQLQESDHTLLLVPVAAILVASIRLHFLDLLLHMNCGGTRVIDCDATVSKGQELGWFEHGSTIIVLAPRGCRLDERIASGTTVRMGRPLLRVEGAQP